MLRLLFSILIICIFSVLVPDIIAANQNVTNQTHFMNVSITNTPPVIDTITLSDSDGGDIDLYPNLSVDVNCSGTITDTDGWSTVNVNATVYHKTSTPDSSASYLDNYKNSSCATTQNTATVANYECMFDFWYNSMPGEWICNVTVIDDFNSIAYNRSNESLGELIAIDIDSGDLDFGSLQIGASTTDSSLDHSVNKTIFNTGNVVFDINIKSYGVGGIGDNNSMGCTQGNITVGMMRYTFNETSEAHNWTLMTSVLNGTGTDENVSLIVSKTTSGTMVPPTNETWWSFKVPSEPVVSGSCSGTIIVTAISDS